jgi:hypothetical protein
MEMTKAYYEATLNHLQSKGFTVQSVIDEHIEKDAVVFNRQRSSCQLDEHCQFVFEAIFYTDGHHDFFLEIVKLGRGRSFSFPLDSWKYHANRIEFKYRDDPETGLGLAITIDLT